MHKASGRTTRISTKGQVILPKAVRDQHGWHAGTELLVEDTPDGVVLKPTAFAPRSRPSDVFGSLKRPGRARSVEEMHAGVLAEARRRHGRGRH